jgi:hypothetical protein
MSDPIDAQTRAKIQALVANLKDRNWRLRNLYWIKDKHGKPIPFVPNAVQEELIACPHNRSLDLKSRQHGLTTYRCIDALDAALFRPGIKCGIIAHKVEDAAAFFNDKVMFAYDMLPPYVKALRPIQTKDNTGKVKFTNGSQIVVSLSHRSGTLQKLHISEYGPMCAMFPERAQEVKSGALNTLAPDGEVSIESTAYGAFGDFYAMSSAARNTKRLVEAATAKLTAMDYAFHFFAWWQDPTNELDPDGVAITQEDEDYFAKIEVEMKTELSARQRAWYVKKAAEQGDKMMREHPSTPDEAFHQAIEGAIYGKHIVRLEKAGQVCDLPILPGIKVNTFWDIGRGDTTCIVFHQQVGPWHHFIDFYENNLEQVEHYARKLIEKDYVYGRHYLPHDGGNIEWAGSGNLTRVQRLQALLGNHGTVVKVERISELADGIEMVRSALPLARFDRVRCGEIKAGEGRGLLPALRAYRYVWNDKVSAFHDEPLHDWASNPADALRTWAEGYPLQGINDETANAARQKRKGKRSWRAA